MDYILATLEVGKASMQAKDLPKTIDNDMLKMWFCRFISL